jgi:hypothetical protein
MITIWQLKSSEADYETYFKYREKARRAYLGEEALTEVRLADYVKVGTIFTENLEEAWQLSQHLEKDWTQSDRVKLEPGIGPQQVRSTDIADILQLGDRYYIILDLGFGEVHPIDVELLPGSAVLGGGPESENPTQFDAVLGGESQS